MTEERIQLEGCGCDDQAPASLWWRIGGSAFLAMNAMVLSISINGSSEVTVEERYMLELSILCLTIPVFFLLSFEFLEATWRAIRRFRLSIELLFLIGIAACLGASFIYFIKRTGNGYADVAAMLLVIYALGRQIGAYGKQRVLGSLNELSPRNRKARRLSGELVTASDVQPGDEIRVLPGEAVPVDLRLTVGAALLHEASVTGESLAVRKAQGDLVKAGSFPLDCSIDGIAVSKGGQTSLDEVRAMIEAGLARPGAEQGVAIQALRWFVPLVLLVSGATFFWQLQAKTWDQAVFTALSVLVVACPCALGFATPLAIWIGIARLRDWASWRAPAKPSKNWRSMAQPRARIERHVARSRTGQLPSIGEDPFAVVDRWPSSIGIRRLARRSLAAGRGHRCRISRRARTVRRCGRALQRIVGSERGSRTGGDD